jgi:hypothetical protein
MKTNLKVEVIEIYPYSDNKDKKVREKGSCHIHLQVGEIGIDVKNVHYQIFTNGFCFISLPGKKYSNQVDEKEKPLFVPSLSFDDPSIFPAIREEIQKELKKDSKTPLKFLEDSSKKSFAKKNYPCKTYK